MSNDGAASPAAGSSGAWNLRGAGVYSNEGSNSVRSMPRGPSGVDFNPPGNLELTEAIKAMNSLETATPTSSSIDFIKFKLGPKAITAICKGARGKSKALSNMGKAPAALKLSSITRLAGANITHTLVGSKFRTCMSLGSSDILEFTPTLLFYDTRSFQSPGVFSRTHTIANVVLY